MEDNLLLGLVAVHRDTHSSMPTSLSLLIPSSTICHHSNWYFNSIQHRLSHFPSRSHPNRKFTPFPGVLNRVLNLYLRKVLNKFNNLYLSLSIPTLIKQPQNPALCIFSLLLLAHACYLLQLLWSIVPFLPYQTQCILSWVMLRLSPTIRGTERGVVVGHEREHMLLCGERPLHGLPEWGWEGVSSS